MNLSELRAYVRTQTQTTSGELPNSVIDSYLQEGFNRTIALENRWPFYQKDWEIVVDAGDVSFPVPGDVNQPGIVALRNKDEGYSIELMDHVTAEEIYGHGVVSSIPRRWSLWGDTAYFWPAVAADTEVTWKLSGYRLAADWIAGGDASEPDCDSRLHRPLAHYAIALAYAAQEDETLDEKAMRRWYDDVMSVREQIMSPPRARPLVMGRRFITPIGGRGSSRNRAIVDTTGL